MARNAALRRAGPPVVAGLALLLGGITVWYAWVVARHLRDDARQTSTLLGRVFAGLNDPRPDAATDALLDLARQVRSLGIAIVVMDTAGHITALDNAPPQIGADTARLRAWIADLDVENAPLVQPGVGTIHYGTGTAARRFASIAALEGAVLLCLALLAGWAYRSQVAAARDRLWVAMARESAHQLGTPLMSLTGWIAYLREHPGTTGGELVEHLQADTERLERVAKRFERIGRPVRQEPVGLGAVAERVVSYFRPRLPTLANAVRLDLVATGPGPTALGDPVLIEWAAARARGGGIGEDARAHGTHRPPHPGPRAGAAADLRGHLHQQGRRGDAGPRRRAARRRSPGPLDRDLPRARGPPAAAGGGPPQLRVQLHDLRRGRLRVLHQTPAGPAGTVAQGQSTARRPRLDLRRQEPHDRARGVRRHRRRSAGAGGGRGVRGARPRTQAGQRDGLRRPAAASAAAVPRAPGSPQLLAAPLRARAGGRVSGHELRPVPAGEAARRPAREPVRGGRRRSGDLRLARRRRAPHARVPAGLPRHNTDQAGAELPFDPGDPRRRERRDRRERAAARQDAVHGEAGRGSRHPAHRRRRAGRGRVARRRARAASRGDGGPPRGDGNPVSHQRPVAGAGGDVPPPRHPLPSRGRRP